MAASTGFLLCWESSHGSGKSSPSPDAVHYYYYCFVARPATTRAQPTTATARSGRCACNPLTFGGKRQSCDQAISASRTSWHNFFFFTLDSTKGKAAARGPPDKATRSAATPEQLYLVPLLPLLLLLLPHAAPFCLIIMMLILLLVTRLPFFLRLHGGRATETASRSRRDFSVFQL